VRQMRQASCSRTACTRGSVIDVDAGPTGLILSTPLTLCLVLMGRRVESPRFLDVLLGDRPALSELIRFISARWATIRTKRLEQAERLLADRTLLDYCDGVVLPALRLAAHDHARRVQVASENARPFNNPIGNRPEREALAR
jgi:hypothetical protein